MLNEGYSQSEIAKELSKPLSWISDIVAGTKVREFADKNSLNTENISTKALSQLRSIPKSKLKRALTQLVKNGGSYKAATQIMQDDKKDESTTYVSSNKDEDLIEPSKFSEKDFYDTDEKDKKESRFSPGTQIDKIGKRLFFKDLWTNRSFVRIIDGKRIVCRIISAVEEYTKKVDIYWWTDERDSKGHNIMQKMVLEDFLIDSEENNKYWWIYEIPDDAIAINLVNFEPIIRRSNDCTNKQKGFANPVSKEIQKRWVVFCRDKKIPESEKTAFKFYQELTGYFENTRKD